MNDIEKISRDECQKLFAQAKTFPEFMKVYLEHMQEQALNFRLKMIKELRLSCEELMDYTGTMPIKLYSKLFLDTINKVSKEAQSKQGQITLANLN